MSIKVAWDDDARTRIVFTYEGRWAWEEFYKSVEESNTLMDSVSHPVHVLINLQNSMYCPKNMLTHFPRMPKTAHPNTGNVVLVGANSMIQAISNLYIRVNGNNNRKFSMVSSLEDGRMFLESEVTPSGIWT